MISVIGILQASAGL